jgi:CheY-like chemotaxis protein
MLSGMWNLQLAASGETTILVADDNEVNLDILVRVLEGVGFRTLQATDGREALEVMRVERPPLALLDIRMPFLSGIEVARAVRDDPQLARSKLIAVSADVLSSLQDELDEAGFDAFLTKPVQAVELLRMIESVLDLEFVSQASSVDEVQAETASAAESDISAIAPGQRLQWATRIRELVGMGDVGQLAEVADELRANPGVTPLADELERLAGAFELDAIEALAERLESDG